MGFLLVEDMLVTDLQVLIEVIDMGCPGLRFVGEDLRGRHLFEVHDDGAQGVAVGGNQDMFTLL